MQTGSSLTSCIVGTRNETSVLSGILILSNAPMPPELLLLLACGSYLALSGFPSILPKNHPANMIIRHLSGGQMQLRPSDIKEISSYCFFFFFFRAAGFHLVLPHSTILGSRFSVHWCRAKAPLICNVSASENTIETFVARTEGPQWGLFPEQTIHKLA